MLEWHNTSVIMQPSTSAGLVHGQQSCRPLQSCIETAFNCTVLTAVAGCLDTCRNGRISMAGVNTKNVGRLAEAMHAVTK